MTNNYMCLQNCPALHATRILQACVSATTQPSSYIENARVAGVEDIFNTRRHAVNILYRRVVHYGRHFLVAHCLPRPAPILRHVARVTEGCGLKLHQRELRGLNPHMCRRTSTPWCACSVARMFIAVRVARVRNTSGRTFSAPTFPAPFLCGTRKCPPGCSR